MQLSETIKLYMTKEQKSLVIETMNQYINTVNSLVSVATNGTSISKCGFHIHRDLLGAINICNSTEYVGDNNIRHTA